MAVFFLFIFISGFLWSFAKEQSGEGKKTEKRPKQEKSPAQIKAENIGMFAVVSPIFLIRALLRLNK